MSAVDAFLVAFRLAAGCWLLWSVPRLVVGRRTPDRPQAGSGVTATVSVVVPARDEADTLPALLATLPPDVDVLVVDDDSTDGTADVARAHGARVLASDPLPDGWIGKSWACDQGAREVSGDTLVFVDADVRFGPGGFDAVVDELASRHGLVSVQPFHRPERPAEHLAAIFNVVSFAGTDAASPLGRRRGVRGAFGPVLATSRRDYERAGGHAAVRSSIVDDVALAARYRSASLPVTVVGGGDAASIRMYPRGIGQLVEGFTKNLVAGVRGVRLVTTALVLAWLTLTVQATVAPIRALVDGDGGRVAAAAVLYALVAAQVWWMARPLGRFRPWVAAAFPLSVGLFLGVFVASVIGALRGQVRWRGRRVSTRPRAPE